MDLDESTIYVGGMIINTNTIVIASTAVCAVTLISYIFLYLTERKSYILQLCIALFMLTLAYGNRYLIINSQTTGVYVIVSYATTIGGYWTFFYGICGLLQKKMSRWWIYIFAICFFTIIPMRQFGLTLTEASIPLSITCGFMFFWLAILVVGTKRISIYERMILGIAFSLWGISIILFPAYSIWKQLPISIGYLLAGCAALTIAITIQGIYFRQIHASSLQKDEKLKQFGMYDKLTGVFNRSCFEEELAAMDVAENLPICIIIGDVNGLKLINDTFGHIKGDELLLDSVSIIRSSCRENDKIARWGGDEFVILLVKTCYEAAVNIVDRINQNSKNFKPKTIPVNLSLGVAEKTSISTPINEILKLADERMYADKFLKSGSTKRTIIDFLQNILWEKDWQTEKHVIRLKEMVTDMGNFLGLKNNEIEELCLIAVLHDIGKIAIPEEILQKPEKLTESEWAIMKKHAETGCRITQSCGELAHISQYILNHHEWWNGCGYPQGLNGEEIPLYSRIIAIVDAYDVMIHDRPYQEAKSSAEALAEIKQQAGIQFDPYLVEVFFDMIAHSYDVQYNDVKIS